MEGSGSELLGCSGFSYEPRGAVWSYHKFPKHMVVLECIGDALFWPPESLEELPGNRVGFELQQT